MNLQQALSIISTKLGKRDHLIKNGTIVNELLLAQVAMEERAFLPWFLIKTVTTSTTAAVSTLARPTGFIREDDETQMKILNASSWKLVTKDNEDTLIALWTGASAGIPINYHLDITNFNFYPTPDATYTIMYKAYFKDTSVIGLKDTETNLWLTYAGNLIITRTAMVLAKNLQNPSLAKALRDEYLEAKQELIGADTAQSVAARDIIKGG